MADRDLEREREEIRRRVAENQRANGTPLEQDRFASEIAARAERQRLAAEEQQATLDAGRARIRVARTQADNAERSSRLAAAEVERQARERGAAARRLAAAQRREQRVRAELARATPYLIDVDKLKAMDPLERAVQERNLMVLRDGMERNPLWRFYPHLKQIEFMDAHERMRWFLGGNRSGKTTTVVVQTLIDALSEPDVPSHLRPFKRWHTPIRTRMIGVTMDQVENVLIETLREWMPLYTLLTGEWKGSYDRERKVLRFANGSSILFNTYEQPPQRHAGVKLHRVVFDEEPPEDIFNENSARLIDFGGDMLCSMTPIDGLTWMFDRFFVPFERGDLRHTSVVQVDMSDNPYLDPVQKQIALSGYSAEEREARETGRFVHFHGRVYPEFDDRHVIPAMNALPDSPQVYVGIDPGIRHMAAASFFWHRQEDDCLIQFDEVAVQGMTVAQFSQQIRLTLLRWKIEEPTMFVIDPSARNRQMGTGQSLQSEFAEQGIFAWPGQNDIRAGINAVKVRMETNRWLICANCIVTITQGRKYRWAPTSRRGQADGPEKPVKADDHILDTWRYVAMLHPVARRSMIDTPFMGEAQEAVRAEIAAAGAPKSFVI